MVLVVCIRAVSQAVTFRDNTGALIPKKTHYHLLRHFIIHFSLTQQSQESIKLRGKLAKQDGVWERWLLTERLFRALRLGEGEELSLTHRETVYILLFHFGVDVNSGLQ